MFNQKRKRLIIILGIACIAVGVIINEFTLELTVISDGAIENPFYRSLIIIFEVAMVSLGLFLICINFRPLLSNILLLISITLFSLLAGELILRIFYTPPPVVAGWCSFFPEVEKNQLGYRGRVIKFDRNDYVILLLGDSQAEGYGCKFESMPERKLETHCNDSTFSVKVFSIAAGGYGQDQQLLALQEFYQRYRADLVILWHTPKNDIWNNIFPTHWPADGMPKPTCILRNDSLYGPNWQIGELIYHSPLRIISLIKHVSDFGSKDKKWERYLPKPYQPVSNYNKPASHDWQVRWDKDTYGMRDENLHNEKSHLAPWLSPRSERMTYGLQLTRMLLSEIEKLATLHKGRLVLFRTVTQEQATVPKDTVYILNENYYRTSTKQFEGNMEYISRGLHSYVIPVTVDNWRNKEDDAHLNETALDQVMKDLATAIKNDILVEINQIE